MIYRIPPYVNGSGNLDTYSRRNAEDWFDFLDRNDLIPDLAPERIIVITCLGKVDAYGTVPEAHAAKAACLNGTVENAEMVLGEEDITRLPLPWIWHTYGRLENADPRPSVEQMAATIWAHLDDLIRGGNHLPVLVKRLRRPKPKKWDAWVSWDRAVYLRQSTAVWNWRKRGSPETFPHTLEDRPRTAHYFSPSAPKGSVVKEVLRSVSPQPSKAAPPRKTSPNTNVGGHIFRTPLGLGARRGASRRTDTWNLIEDGMTVSQLLEAGGHIEDFRIIQRLGHVEMR